MSGQSMRERLTGFFALDDAWQRPTPPVQRRDLITGAVVTAVSLAMLELARSAGSFTELDVPMWVMVGAVTLGCGALVWRRRYPMAVAVYLAVHMFVTGVTMAPVMGQLSLQICYFTGLYSAMAWGRSRRTSALTVGSIIVFMLCWVAWQFALGSGAQEYFDQMTDSPRPDGLLPALPALVALTFVVNIVYFVGAAVGGQVAWRNARQRAELATQAGTIAEQAETLRRRAVVEERLRIARELHDVVGHHVSVIGVQASGAGRVLGRDPEAARVALGAIEESSREAVAQMRSLLGTLRELGDEESHRGSGPGLADLAALVTDRDGVGPRTDYVEVDDAPGARDRVPDAVGRSLYRTVQEALANVARHSTASRASVTLRVRERGTRPFAEVEVLDDGRPRPGSSGSGLGQLGIRERTASHRGECEIGPRATRGYRVRVRLPLTVQGADRD